MLNEEGDLYLGGEGADGDIVVTDKDGKVRITVGGDNQRISVQNKIGIDRIILNGNKGIQSLGSDESAGQFMIEDTQSSYGALVGKTNGLGDGVAGEAVAVHKSGVYGVTDNNNGYGVFGRNKPYDSFGAIGCNVEETAIEELGGEKTPAGVYGRSNHSEGAGIIGYGFHGVYGISTIMEGEGVSGYSTNGTGVAGTSVNGIGVFGTAGTAAFDPTKGYTSYERAGWFAGDVTVDNDFWVGGSKNFIIDHPLDPENKYLVHTSVESSERLNVYSGNIKLDKKGEAWVTLPDWFESLNTDFKYQLTAIGSAAPNLHVAREYTTDNRFKIGGGPPNAKVSWHVTGIRKDAYANAHPLKVELKKRGKDRGFYMHPIEHKLPPERGIPPYQLARKMLHKRLSIKKNSRKTSS